MTDTARRILALVVVYYLAKILLKLIWIAVLLLFKTLGSLRWKSTWKKPLMQIKR